MQITGQQDPMPVLNHNIFVLCMITIFIIITTHTIKFSTRSYMYMKLDMHYVNKIHDSSWNKTSISLIFIPL